MSDDIIVTPSEQLKGLLAMMAAKQTIQERKEVILSDDAEGYLRLENYLVLPLVLPILSPDDGSKARY